tara:strand:+ start:3877 stop:4104 length:228 start_codon:yes stop_codon:yes gene_type:complete
MRMDIIKAADSYLRAKMDGYAFEINGCIQNQDCPESLDRFLSLTQKYSNIAAQQQILENIKSQIEPVKPASENED